MVSYTIPALTTITAGQLIFVGSLVGIAVTGGTAGEVIAVNLHGVYELAKATGAITQGQKVYYDESESKITTTADGNLFVGNAYVAAGSSDATAFVIIGYLESTGVAEEIAAIGTPTAFTAIGGTFADLAAAQTAVSTLKTETKTAVNALETKLDAVIAALKAAGLMAS